MGFVAFSLNVLQNDRKLSAALPLLNVVFPKICLHVPLFITFTDFLTEILNRLAWLTLWAILLWELNENRLITRAISLKKTSQVTGYMGCYWNYACRTLSYRFRSCFPWHRRKYLYQLSGERLEMIEVKQQEEADMIKSHSQLPMYNTVMEVKVEGKLKLSWKDTGDKRLHI